VNDYAGKVRAPSRMPRAIPDQPETKIQSVVVTATDADGGTTVTKLAGDSINLELQPGGSSEGMWIGHREGGRKAIMRSNPLVSGQFVARGVEYAEIEYTEPERPTKRFEVGDIVKLPKGLAPAGIPFRMRGPVMQVDAVVWGPTLRAWYYHFQDRNGNHGFQVSDSPELDAAEKLERWPLRRGDFVVVHEKHQLAENPPLKLLRRVGPNDIHYYEGLKAWYLEAEYGPTHTYLCDEDAVLVDDVKVVKTVKWERG
jgi:hypothetical protein